MTKFGQHLTGRQVQKLKEKHFRCAWHPHRSKDCKDFKYDLICCQCNQVRHITVVREEIMNSIVWGGRVLLCWQLTFQPRKGSLIFIANGGICDRGEENEKTLFIRVAGLIILKLLNSQRVIDEQRIKVVNGKGQIECRLTTVENQLMCWV